MSVRFVASVVGTFSRLLVRYYLVWSMNDVFRLIVRAGVVCLCLC